jgi:hypothetical protein
MIQTQIRKLCGAEFSILFLFTSFVTKYATSKTQRDYW